jgi:hypothetical protein
VTRNPFFPLIDELNESMEWRIKRRGATQRRTNQRLYDRTRYQVSDHGSAYDSEGIEAGHPSDWSDASASDDVNVSAGAWNIGSNADLSWEYTRTTDVDFSDITDGYRLTWQFGPLWWRDRHTVDVAYTFAMASGANEIQARLQFDSRLDQWYLLGGATIGGSLVYGEPFYLSVPLQMPLWLRVAARKTGSAMSHAHVMASYDKSHYSGSEIFMAEAIHTITTPTLRMAMHRASVDSSAVLRIGAVDFVETNW